MRIFSDGFEMGEMGDNIWESLPETVGEMSIPWSVWMRDQNEIVITIKEGNIHIETDIHHFLSYNRLAEKEILIDFLVRCEYCRSFTVASKFCEYCGALAL